MSTAVGSQGRFSPWVRQVCELVASGRLGGLLSTSMIAYDELSLGTIDEGDAYLLDIASGANLLTIRSAHYIDALCFVLGELESVSAVTAISRPNVVVRQTGETVTLTSPDHIAVWAGSWTARSPASICAPAAGILPFSGESRARTPCCASRPLSNLYGALSNWNCGIPRPSNGSRPRPPPLCQRARTSRAWKARHGSWRRLTRHSQATSLRLPRSRSRSPMHLRAARRWGRSAPRGRRPGDLTHLSNNHHLIEDTPPEAIQSPFRSVAASAKS